MLTLRWLPCLAELLAALFLHSVQTQTAQDTFFQNHQLANLIFTQDLLFQSAARSNLECLRQCFTSPCCLTYTYAKLNTTKGGVCRCHSAVMSAGFTSSCPSCRAFYRNKVTETVSAENVTNVAVGKNATQSSTFSNKSPAGKAVDNNRNTSYYKYSCSVTLPEAQGSWWQVDLGNIYDVTSVAITNRGDCCGQRLRDFDVDVYTHNPEIDPSANATQCYHYAGPMAGGATETLTCTGSHVRGRFLRITDAPNNHLQLCEVQVFGRPPMC